MSVNEILETLFESSTLRVCRGLLAGGKTVILKQLSAGAGPQALNRFQHEYQVLKRIDLPGVVKAFELIEIEGGLRMALEDIGGVSLENMLSPGDKLFAHQLLDLASGLAETLAGLDRQGIIHKSINPDHIVVNMDTNQFQLIGFGDADTFGQSEAAMRPPSVFRGRLAYIAPEQTGRMNRRVDYRSDFYSLGATFYRLLVGRPPFEEKDILALVHEHIAVMPPPPHTLDDKIPVALSRIVMKLMAKMAEDRYQSATGLVADLDQCRRCLTDGVTPVFETGRGDFSDRLQIPQKLYGRQAEIDCLIGGIELANTGGRQLLLVTGYAGVGKTALVHEACRLIAERGGHFIEGKFDQLQRDEPYSGWIQAFSGFIRYLLMESEGRLARRRRVIQAAVGNIGRVLTDVLPNLERVIGPQPEVPALPPAEAQNRFNYGFLQLVKAIATPAHPLLIFLDDLQWIDWASLNLLHTLLTSPGIANLMVIGAYRENEVDALHPLTAKIEALLEERAAVETMAIGDLTEKTVNNLIADTLHREPSQTMQLTRLIYARTGGNPFFLHQTLKTLAEKQVLFFDDRRRFWRWDITAIERTGVADNVVTLMVEKIRQLDPETQHLLSLASCIGYHFKLLDLCAAAGLSEAISRDKLQPSLRDGLIVSVGERYRFVHDRVQEAAYALISAEDRPVQHLKIGQHLLSATPEAALADNIFEIVGHLNRGVALITEPEERGRLARLNLIAGRRAKDAAAFPMAANYFASGSALAGPDAWETNNDLSSALLLEQAESEYLIGRFEHSDALIAQVLEKVAELPAKIWAYRLRQRLYQLSGRFQEAMAVSLEALRRFGFSFPETDEEIRAATDKEIRSVADHLYGRRIADLAAIPLSDDVEAQALIGLLEEAMPLVFVVHAQLWPLITAKGVNLCLNRGHANESPFVYSCYAMVLAGVCQEIASAIEFSEMAINLNERLPNGAAWRGKLLFHHGAIISIWRYHFARNLPLLDEAFQASLDAGDLANASYLTYNAIWLHFANGDPLVDVARLARDYAEFAYQNRNFVVYNVDRIEEQFALCLMGKTRSATDFSDDAFDEAGCLNEIAASGFSLGTTYHHIMKLIAAFFAGQYDEALAWANRAAPMLLQVASMANTATYYFYHALTVAARFDDVSVRQKMEFRQILAEALEKMKYWAGHCPENFANRQALIEAEIARIEARDQDAMQFYERAIASAQENGFVHNEAIAYELAATFYQKRGYDKFARTYLAEAVDCYLRWGANGKVQQLKRLHPWITSPGPTEATTLAKQLDALSLAKAQQVISGELHLGRLAQTLLRIVMENAGAQIGFLSVEGARQLRAEMRPDDGDDRRIVFDPSPGASTIPEGLVNYVRRSGETVILADAGGDAGEFAADNYLRRVKPRSVLCMAIQRREKLLAVLYLENNLVAGAFTAERRFVLEVLTAQAAISLETSAVYEALSQLNTELDQRVFDRTAQLEATNKELESFAYSVSHDLRAPLRHIVGFLELLQKKAGKDLDRQSRHYMDNISDSAKKMGQLIDDLLAFSRMGRHALTLQSVDLKTLVAEVVRELMPDTAGRQITWCVGDLPVVSGDLSMLRMVLVNLIANALKFTQPRPVAHIEIGVQPGQDAEEVIFIRDNGVGFDMAYADKLFGVFQRLHLTDEFEGTGIGLATVNRIIARHGGRTWAEGKPDNGAVFYFTLPDPFKNGGIGA